MFNSVTIYIYVEQNICVWFKHMNRPLHLYMLELLTPYLFKSNRRKASQAHPSAKERSSVLKTLKLVGTMFVDSLGACAAHSQCPRFHACE